ncbi:hypothetical protein MNQ96_11450 [Sphingopyxis granuli]|uniref:hypothetical protein n=1 Tax=Sphingopyxis granuli TaxID=267128 RepID=UPI001F5371BF|nr:hypothetical protein [Sphingopyxis granuli]UNK78198.1 hypothetical protein MNQ96_11450 [Sphingopyxis granuli]
MARVSFGNRRAGILAHLKQRQRLDLIAEGLPIIVASARGFWESSRHLEKGSREATVLEGFAEEEAAKALILVDLVRCPAKQVARRAAGIIKTFYGHLGRLIYADAQHWSAVNIDQLREYVDQAREGHALEGYAGEYIVPNWTRYSREAALYADIEVYEDGIPHWSAPRGTLSKSIFGGPPQALLLVEAMALAGMFERKGVRIVHETWAEVDFVDTQGFEDQRRLTRDMLQRLSDAQLMSDTITDAHWHALSNNWQMPMYALDFRETEVPLEDLEAQREAAFWSEVGY